MGSRRSCPGAKGEEGLRELPVELVKPNPRQPRRAFDGAALARLAESIRARGLLQPIVVRVLPGGDYELVAGERRLRAARIAELDSIPAVVREADDWERLDLALAENMARVDLNAIEEARCLRDAGRRPRAHEGGGRAPRGAEPGRDLQPDPPARVARSGSRARRDGRAQRGPRAGDSALQGPRHEAAARVRRPRRCLVGARDRATRAREAETGSTEPPRPRAVGHPDLAEALAAAEDALSAALGAERAGQGEGRLLPGRARVRHPAEAVELAEQILRAPLRRAA